MTPGAPRAFIVGGKLEFEFQWFETASFIYRDGPTQHCVRSVACAALRTQRCARVLVLRVTLEMNAYTLLKQCYISTQVHANEQIWDTCMDNQWFCDSLHYSSPFYPSTPLHLLLLFCSHLSSFSFNFLLLLFSVPPSSPIYLSYVLHSPLSYPPPSSPSSPPLLLSSSPPLLLSSPHTMFLVCPVW